MSKTSSALSPAFIKQFGRYVLVQADGSIAFTASGRKKYGSLFARYGKRLQDCLTLDAFCQHLHEVLALEHQRADEQLHACLRDGSVAESEKRQIRAALGLPEPTQQRSQQSLERPAAQVIDLAQWRRAKGRS